MRSPAAFLRCCNPDCAATVDVIEARVACASCGALLDVAYEWDTLPVPAAKTFAARRGSVAPLDFSGVWRFRELLPFFRDEADIHTIGEGRTILQTADRLAGSLGMPAGTLQLQYEGLNPSGSFKDNGMTSAFTHARMAHARRVACASTGNTSASMALYAAMAGLPAVVLVGGGRVASGKLAQTLDHGAMVLEVDGDFDTCLRALRELSQRPETGLYVMNSVNPFRLEGQKTIIHRVLDARDWRVPDWIIVPGGNLGNTAAFGKALVELRELGLIDRLPRLAVVVAKGAGTFYQLVEEMGVSWNGGRWPQERVAELYAAMDEVGFAAHTVASAIEIGRPVNLPRALRALEATDGLVRQVSDEQIVEGRALVARFGFGCEPASGATVAGLRLLLDEQAIANGQEVVCILTGHELKDPDRTLAYHAGGRSGALSNRPRRVAGDVESILAEIQTRPPSHPKAGPPRGPGG